MKKRFFLIFISIILSLSLLLTACGETASDSSGGKDSAGPGTVSSDSAAPSTSTDPSTSSGSDSISIDDTEVTEDGVITYEKATCECIVGVADSGTVATAVASNGARIVYTLDEESRNALNDTFGGALTIAEDGTIKGTYNTANKKRKIKVTANAARCESVTAEITISVINPRLTFEGAELVNARKGEYYATSVALVKNEGVSVKYTRASGTLPKGLTLSGEGVISGTIDASAEEKTYAFTVRAGASGYSSADVEFEITVEAGRAISSTASSITNFGTENEVTALDAPIVTLAYNNQVGVSANASAGNGNPISYELAEGSELPEGFTLYQNGAIFGVVDKLYECTFSVVASAEGCDPVTRQFSIKVRPNGIYYESTTGIITRGEAANYSLATAIVEEEGVNVEYIINSEDAAEIKREYNLEVSTAGIVTGTPGKIKELVALRITAQAEGYKSVTQTMYLVINEPLQVPANGRFEGEYISFKGKNGTGYSSSPEGKDMIDTAPPEGVTASNGAFINYTYNDTLTLEFVIYAESAASNVRLLAALGSEIGNVTFTPESFGVYTYVGQDTTGTKTTINYGSVSVSGGAHYTSFNEYQLGTVNLAQGWNVIQFAIHTNTLREGTMIGGPAIDYIRLDTSVTLKWVPLLYNLS